MAHSWHVGGSNGHYVNHSSREDGSGADSIGVGLSEDVLGPFPSNRMAHRVRNALASAYLAGLREEPAVVVEGVLYPVLSTGDAVCPECAATRPPGRIADHMMSEHSEDDDSDDEDELTF